jgi:hypothetical protein
VVATALATFALAVGAVAYDGSKGQTAASTTTPATVVHASTDTTSGTDTTSSTAGDVVETHQS